MTARALDLRRPVEGASDTQSVAVAAAGDRTGQRYGAISRGRLHSVKAANPAVFRLSLERRKARPRRGRQGQITVR